MAKSAVTANGVLRSQRATGLRSGQVWCSACKSVVTSECPHSSMTARERRRMKAKEEKKMPGGGRDRGAPGDRGFEKKSDQQRAKEITGKSPPEKGKK